MDENEKKIRKILTVVDGISYTMAFYELFIKHAISFGLLLTFISMLLNFAIWGMHNTKNLKSYVQSFVNTTEYSDAARKYFVGLTIVYVLIETAAVIVMFLIRPLTFTKLFLALTAIPICYSCLTLGVKFYDIPQGSEYGETQALFACAPHVLIVAGTLFTFNLLAVFLSSILMCLYGFLVYLIAKYVQSKL